MRTRMIIMTIGLLCLVGASVLTSEATTTFIGSTIERIDPAQQTVTFRTREGQSWTMPVADPNILKKEQVAKGDQVSIEIDPKNTTITKIIRLAQRPESDQSHSPGPALPPGPVVPVD